MTERPAWEWTDGESDGEPGSSCCCAFTVLLVIGLVITIVCIP